MREFQIAVFAGDGIGPEVMAPCLLILEDVVSRNGKFQLHFRSYEAGAEMYRRTGTALPADSLNAAREADAVLFGAMGMPEVRYPDGTEIVPQIEFREQLELYAGMRPVKIIPGTRTPLADPRAQSVDFVMVRESTEGLFAARKLSQRQGNEAVLDTMKITRGVCERLFRFAFDLARRRGKGSRKPRVTCVDKANVLPSMAFFRSIFLECAGQYPDVEAQCAYVDAIALQLIQSPWEFDVLVTENMFGDILSDLGAALMGGMGMAPSADIGDRHAVFQPCHGTAPGIARRGLANPTAMFLSAALMLEWLGDHHKAPECREAARALTQAVIRAFADGALVPTEMGGSAGTATITNRVLSELNRVVVPEYST